MIAKLYQRFWFATEFWVTPVDRRPLTFIFRDWIYSHVPFFLSLVSVFYGGIITLSIWHGTTSTIISALGNLLLAHLVWGTKWIEQQQEWPEYLG